MDGPMSRVVPEVVEQYVGNVSRTLYKLEKKFAEVPAAKKLATRVFHSLFVAIQHWPA